MSAPWILSALRGCLSRHGLLQPNARLVAAVSGGSDSMALLYGLHLLQQEVGFALHACHVQHGLRGADSLADEQLVRDCCTSWEIPLTVHTAQLGGDLHLPGMETRARDCRRAIFAEEMRRLHAHAFLLAHHQDDQTETVLLHLLRGAGANGLSGMREAAPFADGLLLRPFLSLPKADLLAALTHWQIPHREDASNQEAMTPRNALRLDILPRLESLFPGCTARMAQTARLLRRDEEALGTQARHFVAAHSLTTQNGLHAIDTQALGTTDGAVAIRALRLWYADGLHRAGITPSEQSLNADDSEALLCFALGRHPQAAMASTGLPAASNDLHRNAHTLNLPGGLQALKGARWLHLQHQDGSPVTAQPNVPQAVPLSSFFTPVPTPGSDGQTQTLEDAIVSIANEAASSPLKPVAIPLPGWDGDPPYARLTLTVRPLTPACAPDTAQVAYVPVSLLPGCVLRTPQPGDTIHPLGASGAKPLRRYLTNRKIDPPFRPLLPVLANGDTILWIPGLCTAQPLAQRSGTPCLCLTLTQAPPYLNTRKGDERHG